MSGEPAAFNVTDRFDPFAMQEFMRRPEIYWPTNDALALEPEETNFVEHMTHPRVWTVAATYGDYIIGYVLFNQRTSIAAEIQCGFHMHFRGRVAKAIVEHAIGLAFRDRGLLKIIAIVPEDLRQSIYGVRRIGFKLEGRLTKAMVRKNPHCPIADLLIFGLSKETQQ